LLRRNELRARPASASTGSITARAEDLALEIHRLAAAGELEDLQRFLHGTDAAHGPDVHRRHRAAAAAHHDLRAPAAQFVQRQERSGHLQRVQLEGTDGDRAHVNAAAGARELREAEERIARVEHAGDPDASQAVAFGHAAEDGDAVGRGVRFEDQVDAHHESAGSRGLAVRVL
jgi:hypothetical protein